MQPSAPKANGPEPKRRISGVHSSETGVTERAAQLGEADRSGRTVVQTPEARRHQELEPFGSSGTLPAIEPIERRALPFSNDCERRNHSSAPPPQATGHDDDVSWNDGAGSAVHPDALPSSLMPVGLKSNPPGADDGFRAPSAMSRLNQPVVLAAALLLVTAIATAVAWLVWST